MRILSISIRIGNMKIKLTMITPIMIKNIRIIIMYYTIQKMAIFVSYIFLAIFNKWDMIY